MVKKLSQNIWPLKSRFKPGTFWIESKTAMHSVMTFSCHVFSYSKNVQYIKSPYCFQIHSFCQFEMSLKDTSTHGFCIWASSGWLKTKKLELNSWEKLRVFSFPSHTQSTHSPVQLMLENHTQWGNTSSKHIQSLTSTSYRGLECSLYASNNMMHRRRVKFNFIFTVFEFAR
jgi:hypothetical protein